MKLFTWGAATAAGQRHRLSHALASIDRNGQPAAPTRTSGLPRVTARPFAAGVCSAGRIVGSARGSPGEGIAGAPAHIIAFQPSHMQPVGLTDFRLGGAPDQNRFAVLARVDPVCVWDAPAPCGRRITRCG